MCADRGKNAQAAVQPTVAGTTVHVVACCADILLPGVDGLPSATERGAHLRAIDVMEKLQRGSTTLLVRLLDMNTRTFGDYTTFLDAPDQVRSQVLRALAADDLDEMRDLVDGLYVATLSAYYAGRDTEHPGQKLVWDVLGFHGPSDGHLGLVERSAA